MREHRRGEDEIERTHSRKSDTDKVALINQWIDRYGKIMLMIGGLVFGWFTTSVVKPLRAIPTVVKQQALTDTAMIKLKAQLDMTNDTQKEVVHAVSILTRMQCLKLNAEVRAISDLSCSSSTGVAK